MTDIRVLDDQTINKIAAGEVVERPVSVVKELVENAIDAKSTAISIEIKGGGIDSIRVTDNGTGINRDDIPLAFTRHATSKIRTAEDLAGVASLGFRGEALSSVSSVAKVELITKKKNDILGYRYRISGGRQLSFDEAGAPEGTTVIVKDLFFNTPARRKFLKSAATEGNCITELIEKLILSHPGIAFKYTADGRVKLASDGSGDIRSCIYSVFGRGNAALMVEADLVSENCSITGFVGKPEIGRGNRNFELFFVNGRCVKSRILSAAVEEAYKPFLMLHKFPFVILYFDIPSELLDVNVHPSKTEIRFMEDMLVASLTGKCVTSALTKKELISDALHEESEKSTPPADIPEPFEYSRIKEYTAPPEPVFEQETMTVPLSGHEEEPVIKPYAAPVQETLFKGGFLDEENHKKHRIIGQVFDTYWIIEYEHKMYIIDQHAAHEKVLYERFSKQIQKNEVISQMISPAFIVTLSKAEEEVVRDHMNAFAETGFTVEHFGGSEYALSSVPVELFGMSPQDYFLSMLDEIVKNRRDSRPEQIKDRIATMACKAAVKGNMSMTFAEADALIAELFKLDNPYNCPHGRPTVIAFSQSDLEKLFKRIV